MNYKHSEFKKVPREEFYHFLRSEPGLHTWSAPRCVGFTDNKGVCHGVISTKPEGVVEFYINVVDHQKYFLVAQAVKDTKDDPFRNRKNLKLLA